MFSQMMLKVKSSLVRTPLEEPANWLRHLYSRTRLLKHPELSEIHREPLRIDLVVKRLIGESTNCIDVGCHIGSMLSMIMRLAPRGRHLAIEPVPHKADWLRRKFPEVEIHQVAACDQIGQSIFYENRAKAGFSGLRSDEEKRHHVHELVVPCDRLDNIAPRDRTFGFIKIDVFGAELLVLRGAIDLIRRDSPAIILEDAPGNIEKFGLTSRDLYAFVTEELSYSIFTPRDFLEGGKPLGLSQFEEAHRYPFRAIDYVMIKR